MEDTTFMVGSVSASILLTLLLSIVYSTISIPKKYQPLIAILIGIGLGLIAMVVQGIPFEVKSVIEYCVKGLMVGATAVGLHQAKKKVMKPKGIE